MKSGRWIVWVQMIAVWVGSWAVAGAWQGRMDERDADLAKLLISQEQFAPLHSSQQVLTVDVRSMTAWAEGRIAGAVHVPLANVEARASDIRALAKGRMVVAYCSCPTEGTSLLAAEILTRQGITARALVGGFPKWLERGGRVER